MAEAHGAGRRGLAGLVLAWALAGLPCGSLGASVPTSGGELDRWLDEDLGPWLTARATEHPRLRGERLSVAVVAERSPHPTPDALADGVREWLHRALIDSGGVLLAREPAPPDWQRTIGPRLDCRPSGASYLVAVSAARQGDRGEVDVRILDLTEDTWVAGFARRWEGRLTKEERSAASRRVAIESLRGRRGLPFEAGQADILAGRLAHGLGCALLARPAEPPSVWIDAPGDGAFDAAVSLVGHYLARGDLLRIAADRGRADMALSARVHDVDGETGQLWVSLRPLAEGGDAGVEAAAYVRTSGAATKDAGVPPEPPAAAMQAEAAAAPVLEAFRVLRLPRPCRPDDCDARGEVLDPSGPLAAGEALALEAVAAVPADVFVLELVPGRGLRRLAPGSCRADAGIGLAPGHRLRHALDGADGERTIFAIALRDGSADAGPARLLAELPAGCGGRPLTGPRLSAWLGELERAGRYPDVSWRALRLAFVPVHERPLLADERP